MEAWLEVVMIRVLGLLRFVAMGLCINARIARIWREVFR
jgi:hypothetical protein